MSGADYKSLPSKSSHALPRARSEFRINVRTFMVISTRGGQCVDLRRLVRLVLMLDSKVGPSALPDGSQCFFIVLPVGFVDLPWGIVLPFQLGTIPQLR